MTLPTVAELLVRLQETERERDEAQALAHDRIITAERLEQKRQQHIHEIAELTRKVNHLKCCLRAVTKKVD